MALNDIVFCEGDGQDIVEDISASSLGTPNDIVVDAPDAMIITLVKPVNYAF